MLRNLRLAVLLVTATLAVNAFALELTPYDTWYGVGEVTRISCDTVSHTVLGVRPGSGELVTFDSNGSVLNSIADFSQPTGAAAMGSSRLMIDGRSVKKIASDGTVLVTMGLSDTFFIAPHDVTVSTNGRVYVADADDFIKVFDASTGNFLFQFGGHGRFNGQMDVPVAITVNDVRGELIVCDQNNYRLQLFDLNGDSLAQWGAIGNGNYAPAEFLRPWGMDIDALGRIWVWDALLDAVEVFSPQGDFLFMCRPDVAGLHAGLDLAIDGGLIYLSAPATGCIYVFQAQESTPTPPEMAIDLTIHPAADGIHLRWRSVPGALEYHLFRSATCNFEAANTEDLGAIPDTHYTDAVLPESYTCRFYRLDAVFAAGFCNVPLPPPGVSSMQGGAGEVAVLDDGHDSPHEVQNGLSCRSCHATHFPYPWPVPSWYHGDHLCKSCHVETGMATASQNHATSAGPMHCNICHDPHDQQTQYPHEFIRTAIVTPNSGIRSVLFNHATDFIHGAPNYDGVCEVCHTQTGHHRNNAGGDHSHHAGEDCAACHRHRQGFAAPAN